MSDHELSAQNLMASLPQALLDDPDLAALAASIADILAKRKEEIMRVAIYARIDDLPEDLLDILAHDFKVDWYNPDYPIDAKRALLKSNWSVHRRLGTKDAIATALSDIHPGSVVEEWFEFGGDPFTFRAHVDITGTDPQHPMAIYTKEEIERRLVSAKRFGAQLDGMSYQVKNGIVADAAVEAWTAEPPACGTIFCGSYPSANTVGGVR